TPASRRQDHTASPYEISVTRQLTPSHPSHPAPTFVTIAKRPSSQAREGRSCSADLGYRGSGLFLPRGLDFHF
ncbi:MAG TPA: hypothetical protein VJS63_03940, partial [Bradyrhizobium sp.]|nr:hypothetical protein [Bradyrhizobium sp.]